MDGYTITICIHKGGITVERNTEHRSTEFDAPRKILDDEDEAHVIFDHLQEWLWKRTEKK